MMKSNCTYPGVDINSDHVLLMIKVKLEMKCKSRKVCYDLERLGDENTRTLYNVEIQNRYDALSVEDDQINDARYQSEEEIIDKEWLKFKSSVEVPMKEVLPGKS